MKLYFAFYPLSSFFGDIVDKFYTALVVDNRYQLLLTGLWNTIIISLCATVIGFAIGIVIALVKYFAIGSKAMAPLKWLCDLYITVIRGTPVVVQLLILSVVILSGVREGVLIAIIAFGINSGAYVAEIIRAGIYAVDKGQTEAGRSLGLSKIQTMRDIVMPQAIKNILPALGNEFIVLLKETSIAGYIAVHDLTKGAELIKGTTYDGTALFVAAGIYLVMVIGLTKVQHMLERRFGKSDIR